MSKIAKGAVARKLEEATKFFMEHAGYATPPGQAACARRLANAERRMAQKVERGEARYTVEQDDIAPEDTYTNPEDIADVREGRVTLWVVALESQLPACKTCGRGPDWNGKGASCGAIGVDASKGAEDPYIRVVMAELASEVLS